MGKSINIISAASVVAILLGGAGVTMSAGVEGAGVSVVDEGKAIAFDRKKGNCLACHAIEGGSLPGNIGPPLVNMKERFPNKDRLRAQIWDATKTNPNTIMPPFGRHEILTAAEIEKVVEFVYSL